MSNNDALRKALEALKNEPDRWAAIGILERALAASKTEPQAQANTEQGERAELKPCPFCGEASDLRVHVYGDDAYVQCRECTTCGPDGGDRAGAIAKWNYRAAAPMAADKAGGEVIAKCRREMRGPNEYVCNCNPGECPQPQPSALPDVPLYGIIDPDYARVYTQARIVAWQYGYACVMHGSFTRDLDLLLVPWTEKAQENHDQLLRLIAQAAFLQFRDGQQDIIKSTVDWTDKPHGRKSCSLFFRGFGDRRWVDISVLPCKIPKRDDEIGDAELLAKALEVLSYATYHDGRYGQENNYEKFQQPAQELVGAIAKRLGVEAYA